MATLKALYGDAFGQTYRVDEPSCVLGRQSDCHISKIFSGLPYVSRHHARIEKTPDGFFVVDLESRHGTRVNGKRIVGPHRIRHGDRLSICEVEFEFCQPSEFARFIQDAAETSIESTIDIGSSSDLSSWRVAATPDKRLRAMVEMLACLGRSLDLGDVLDNLLTSLLEVFPQSECGFIGLTEKDEKTVTPAAIKFRQPSDEGQISVSSSIVHRMMDTKEAVLLKGVMCAPLVGPDESVIGVIQMDSGGPELRFSQDDLEVLAAVSRLATVALEYSRLHKRVVQQQTTECDLAMARRVQTSLLPHNPPKIRGYQFHEFYRAAHTVGGDYYDYIPLADDRLAIVVADASGKGVTAALMVSTLSGELKYWLGREPSPGLALRRVNERVTDADCEGRFVTAVLAVLEPRSHAITLANAGHPQPFLRSPGGVVTPVGGDVAGLPLGVKASERYGEHVLNLQPGESITMFTDGFNEAMNSEEQRYGLERLRRMVGTKARNVKQLVERIVEDVERFVQGHDQSDDMCLACVGRE